MSRLEPHHSVASRKLRIAVWHHLPGGGGGERALYYHIKGLIERGHSVEIWSPPADGASRLPLGSLAPEHIVRLELSRSPATTRLPGITWLRPIQAMTADLQALDDHCRNCAEAIQRGGFDLLFANTCVQSGSAPIGRHVALPTVLYLQEPHRALYEAMPRFPWLALPGPRRFWWSPRYLRWFIPDLVEMQARRLQAREEVANAQAFDRILVNSFYSRESVLRAYGLEATVCYLGIDTALFRPTGIPRQGFVLGLGGLQYIKGVDRAIRALATLDPSQRPALVWVGGQYNSGYTEHVLALAAARGVHLDVKRHVTDAELVTLFNQAAVLLCTSRLEPFGYAPLEAHACGTPVAAIAEGGLRETIQDGVNGLLVDGDDPVPLGQLIQKLLQQPDLASRLCENGRKTVLANWSWSSALDRLEHQLLQVGLSRPSGHAKRLRHSANFPS